MQHIEDIRERGVYFYEVEDAVGSEPSFEYVKTGVSFALKKKAAALITAPISKKKWLRAGIKYSGHTGYLAESAGIKDYSMFFWSKDLKVSLFTVHIPLQEVFEHIKKDKIVAFVRHVNRELLRLFKGAAPPTYLLSGLNPHAGEGGFLGKEEEEEILPALEILAGEDKMDITGPFPPDTVFLQARERKNSVVICWYHDQGLIPFKLLNIHSGVNVTLGLPYIRTSPDHGTAYDIAGTGRANPSSMLEAIKLADRLTPLAWGGNEPLRGMDSV